MRKTMTGGLLALSLTAGSIGVAALTPIGTAGAAQTADETEGAASERPRRGAAVLEEALASLVADGTLTEPQAAAVERRVAETAREGLEERWSTRRERLDEIAGLLGMPVEDLVTELRSGSSLADIAGERTDELIALLVEGATERIQGAVAAGRIDEARAERLLGQVEERVTALVEGEAGGRLRDRLPVG